MNSTFKSTLFFSLGAIVGAIGGIIFAKNRYDKNSNKEIAEIREMYRKKYEVTKEKTEEKPEEAYEKIACEYHTEDTPKKKKNPNIKVINPMDFGDDFSYETVSLTYYADNVLAYDVNDDMVTDIENTVGTENLAKIKEYYDEPLYIKNDILRVYYEIMPSEKTYAEVTGWINDPE